MRRTRFTLGVITCGSLLAAANLAQAATVTIDSWHVGSGQPKDNFQLLQDLAFPGGELQLGLRATYRQSAVPAPESGGTYTVLNGSQQAGVGGAIATNSTRAKWNFDYHIYYAGGVTNLDSIVLTITSPAGNTVAVPSGYDMKVANNDNVTGNEPYPTGDSQNPAFYIQDSQNPVFAPWFVPTFDMNVIGVYTFTLTATEGATVDTQTMNVNVVPEPASLSLIGAGLSTLFMRRRMR